MTNQGYLCHQDPFLILIVWLDGILCSIDGHHKPRINATRSGEDPCNPLYWYPRPIPGYCNYRDVTTKAPLMPMIPMPIPVHLPPPLLPPIIGYPLPFGIPLSPTNPMLPVATPPYPTQPKYEPAPAPPPPLPIMSPFASYVPPYGIQRRTLGMVPGIPGLVSPDGGINISPFSDAYSDLLEKHKQKMIRRRLKKLLDEYDRYPWKVSYKYSRRMDTKRQKGPQILSRKSNKIARESEEMPEELPEDNARIPLESYRAVLDDNVGRPLERLQEHDERESQEMFRELPDENMGPHDILRELPEDNVPESQEISQGLPTSNVREPQDMLRKPIEGNARWLYATPRELTPEDDAREPHQILKKLRGENEITQNRDQGINKRPSLEEMFEKYDFLKKENSYPLEY